MAELRVPKLNNNDTAYLLVEWLVADGAEVGEDDPVVLVETSKAAEELPAGGTGVLGHAAREGAWCRPGDVIATVSGPAPAVSPPPAAPASPPASPHPSPPASPPDEGEAGPLVTAPARALMAELGVTREQVAALGLAVVRRADIERLAGRPPAEHPPPQARQAATGDDARPPREAPAGERPLPRVQRAVARAVELAHRTIPAAYLVVRMDLGPALARGATLTKEVRRPVGLAELFVEAVAGLHDRFPLFFATVDGDRALLADTPHIGLTVDLGDGLYVPVVHDAARRTTRDIATTVMRYRLAATTGDFRERDLSGANFVITLHTEGGVVLAIPFVFPGTSCALAVTAPQDGTLADIGLAYDHRLINGRDAALFMSALKAAVEGLT
ncbi:2-oxoglutarate dehydrogenase E2 component (dihydrolipoamide succinyltransferase) [Nonomuraea muscovyensis]|uniref:Dihydrolipoamide acetyltransferase component of pyruvate dehydrogenase complex n=1 Tax=Nonomuraea muscovyensis TaxID=1124761 RepID=A0A7X0EY26_9ACTN|nr:2-oxo acid dehydrogenase subunit E2 [Nonomuraea muscovyensis]MBB6348228.1 2-oxoglutarate dehydrogenase E2 component (dihydrolipoamide succinyltransferase) [Nonomuraea muscovyensis]